MMSDDRLFEKPGLKRSKEEDEALIEFYLRRFRVEIKKEVDVK